jgi:ABC-2 type transport system ATP-binding protein
VIVIHHGRLLFDGLLSGLVDRFEANKTVSVTLADPTLDVSRFAEVVDRSGDRVTLRVPKAAVPRVTSELLAHLPVLDLAVEEPPIDDVIERVFATEVEHLASAAENVASAAAEHVAPAAAPEPAAEPVAPEAP